MGSFRTATRSRLFVGVLRDAIGATLIAPSSLRGRPGAPVPAPIDWSEVDDPGLCAGGICLRDLRSRLDRRGEYGVRCGPRRVGRNGDARARERRGRLGCPMTFVTLVTPRGTRI